MPVHSSSQFPNIRPREIKDKRAGAAEPTATTGVPVSVEWVTVASAGDKKRAVFFAHMPAGSLSFDPAGRDQLNFDFAAMAF